MTKCFAILFCLCFLLVPAIGSIGIPYADSIMQALKSHPAQDTVRVNLLNEYVRTSRHKAPKEAMAFGEEALAIARELNYIKGQSDSYYNMSMIYNGYGNYTKAIDYAGRSLAMDIIARDSIRIATSLSNIGSIYNSKEDFPKAIRLFFQSLRYSSSPKREVYSIGTLISIGGVFSKQGNFGEAMKYYKEALAIAKKYHDIDNIANVQHNMAVVYEYDNKYDEALSLYFSSVKIAEGHDLYTMADSYNNIAGVYYVKQKMDSCLYYALKSKQLRMQIGDTAGVVSINANIASLYVEEKRYDLAIKTYEEGIEFCKKSKGNLMLLESIYKSLAEVYHDLKDDAKAYNYQQLYQQLNDSLFTLNSSQQIAEMQTKYDTEKKEARIVLLDKEQALNASEIAKQRIMLGALLGIILLVAGISVMAYRAYKSKQKANLELGEKNREIESQKHILEERNKEITDSIHYAGRIQHALISSADYVSQHVPGSFVLYQPKDIVSGDFCWALNLDGEDARRFYLATADCTGHGVPGAFMSLLNISVFNEVVIDKKITRPDLVLNEARREIIRALNPKGNEDTKDGMDCVLCCYEFPAKAGGPVKLQYGAANNGFYIVRNGKLIVCAADKMPVGKSPRDGEPFTLHSVELHRHDIVYTFTDGYADQFGGEKGKKFKYKQLEELLLSIHQLPMAEQEDILRKRLSDWKGNLEQVDDVLIIGVRI